MNNNDFILTDEQSNKLFHIPTVTTTKSSVKAKMQHKLRYPDRKLDMVPGMKHNLLMSTSNFVDANYITVLIM